MKNTPETLNILNPDFRMPEHCGGDRWSILHGDSLQILRQFEPNSFDAIITDPPYASGGSSQTTKNRSTNEKYSSMSKEKALPDFDSDQMDQVEDGKLYVHFWQDHDFELKRDVLDVTEFKKLLNRPKKPKMQLLGQDGNIFAIMGRASRLLKNARQSDKAKEMCDRVTASQSYSEALNIVSEYVETELSPSPTPKRDRGDAR